MFACKAKRFAIIFFLFFFLLLSSFGRTTESFLGNVLTLVIKEVCDQDLIHFLDTPKGIWVKIVPQVVIPDACYTWQGLFMVTNIDRNQKSTRNSLKKVGHKLASQYS